MNHRAERGEPSHMSKLKHALEPEVKIDPKVRPLKPSL